MIRKICLSGFATTSKPTARNILWISIVRISGTLFIYVYHLLGIYGFNNQGLEVIGISLLCFVSGYLVEPKGTSIVVWFIKRYFVIMIPFWIVYLIVIICNYLFGYKPAEFWNLLIVLFFGGMCVPDPLYVVSWFISFILILYFFAGICSLFQNKLTEFVVALSITAIYYFTVHRYCYYIFPFFVAYYLRKYLIISDNSKYGSFIAGSRWNINLISFFQNRCYAFFLVHGGCLLFCAKVLQISFISSMVLAFVISTLLSIILYNMSSMLISRVNIFFNDIGK